MLSIHQRPFDPGDRAEPGHWEGDLIVGHNHGSAIGTLVGRTTRMIRLLHLPERDAHAPWQRGSNENANGLLRQYFPEGTDLTVHTPAHLRAVEDEINKRPRMVLADRSPAELFAALLASPELPPLRR